MMISTVSSASAKTSPSSMVSIGTSSSFNNCVGGSRATGNHMNIGNSPVSLSKDSGLVDASSNCSSNSASANTTGGNSMSNSLTQRLVSLNFGHDRKDKRNSSGRSGSASTSGLGASSSKNSSQVRFYTFFSGLCCLFPVLLTGQ